MDSGGSGKRPTRRFPSEPEPSAVYSFRIPIGLERTWQHCLALCWLLVLLSGCAALVGQPHQQQTGPALTHPLFKGVVAGGEMGQHRWMVSVVSLQGQSTLCTAAAVDGRVDDLECPPTPSQLPLNVATDSSAAGLTVVYGVVSAAVATLEESEGRPVQTRRVSLRGFNGINYFAYALPTGAGRDLVAYDSDRRVLASAAGKLAGS